MLQENSSRKWGWVCPVWKVPETSLGSILVFNFKVHAWSRRIIVLINWVKAVSLAPAWIPPDKSSKHTWVSSAYMLFLTREDVWKCTNRVSTINAARRAKGGPMTKLTNPASVSLETKEAPCDLIAIHQPLHCQNAESEAATFTGMLPFYIDNLSSNNRDWEVGSRYRLPCSYQPFKIMIYWGKE